MSHHEDEQWDNILICENYSEDGISSSSSSDMEEGSEKHNSSCSDDLIESDFVVDEVFLDDDLEGEIQLVGERTKGKEPLRANVGVHVREPGSHPMSQSQKGKGSQMRVYNEDENNSDFEFEVGLCFNSAYDFRDAVRMHATTQGKPLKFIKNCSDKIKVTCDCGWSMFASFMSKSEKTFQVKRHGMKYTCSNCGMRGHTKRSCHEAPMSQDTTSSSWLKQPVRRNN